MVHIISAPNPYKHPILRIWYEIFKSDGYGHIYGYWWCGYPTDVVADMVLLLPDGYK
jgi:hypothetical protein